MIKWVKCSQQINNLITILYQNTTDDKVLGNLDLSKVSYHTNAAPVILALLTAAGLACDANGKELWRLADPATKLYWQQPKAANTRQPAERAAAALHGLGDAPLEHDEEAAVKGPAARLRAAEKTRPSALRVLASAPPPAKTAILKQGTGWGSMPRPITSRCVADQVRRARRRRRHRCYRRYRTPRATRPLPADLLACPCASAPSRSHASSRSSSSCKSTRGAADAT